MPLKTHLDQPPNINMTPMIDVVFLLIIFFMVGTQFTDMERKFQVQVPAVKQAGALSPAPSKRVVHVHRDGRVALDDHFVTLEELTSTLAAARQEYEDLGVIVRGDAEGPFQHVAETLGAVRQAGVAEMGISVRMAKKR